MPAKTAEDLHKEKLALFISKDNAPSGGDVQMFLYDANALLREFFEHIHWTKKVLLSRDKYETNNEDKPALAKEALESLREDIDLFARGTIVSVDWPSCEAAEIRNVAARHGYGPFLYNAVGSIVGWIMSDRETITRDALRIWNFMYKHPEMYDRKKIPEKPGCESRSTKGGSQKVTHFAYKPKNKVSVQTLTNNHEKAVSKLLEHGVTQEQVKGVFHRIAVKFFDDLYF